MRYQGYKLSAASIQGAVNPYVFYLEEQNLCQFGYRKIGADILVVINSNKQVRGPNEN